MAKSKAKRPVRGPPTWITRKGVVYHYIGSSFSTRDAAKKIVGNIERDRYMQIRGYHAIIVKDRRKGLKRPYRVYTGQP